MATSNPPMSSGSPAQPLSQALAKRRNNPLPLILIGVGILAALGFAAWGYLEAQRTEHIVVAARTVPYGQRIVAEDLTSVEVPLHRPHQLAGIADPVTVVGQYAARPIGADDVLQATMLMAAPPDQPTFPNGARLTENHIALPFSIESIGPLNTTDLVNIGFMDSTGDPQLCRSTEATAADSGATNRPYACRLLSRVQVLYIEGSTAWLQVTPYQAQSVRAIQAAGLQLYGERYGVASSDLPALERLDISQVNNADLTSPAPAPEPSNQ